MRSPIPVARRWRRLAGAQGERHRRLEKADLRVHFLEAGAAELPPRREEIDQGAESKAIGSQDRLVGALGGLDHRGGHVEATEAEPYVGIRFPDFADRPIASGRHLLLCDAALSLG